MLLSVLMSVYGKEKPAYLLECLNSLCNQSLKADEIVLVEDGPLTDELLTVIDNFRSELPIKSIKLELNVGLAVALNEGLKYCTHELVARMDSDDISLPERFEKQVKFMMDNPDIAVSSAVLQEFDDTGKRFSSRTLPLSHDELVIFAKTRSPISHAVAIFRKKIVIDVGGYPLFKRSQDVALWSLLIIKGYKLANLPETLFLVRAGDEFMARSGLKNFKYEYDVINYQREIGFLSLSSYVTNVLIRLFIAILPSNFKKILYAYAKK